MEQGIGNYEAGSSSRQIEINQDPKQGVSMKTVYSFHSSSFHCRRIVCDFVRVGHTDYTDAGITASAERWPG